jgi:ribonucleotide monophosphatase NagD (HAD superfamily)
VVGEAGLTTAVHEAGYTLTERSPDYVVLGETRTYRFNAHSESTVMIGDRMDTDIVAGLEAGLGTILVLRAVTAMPTPTATPSARHGSSSRSPSSSASSPSYSSRNSCEI